MGKSLCLGTLRFVQDGQDYGTAVQIQSCEASQVSSEVSQLHSAPSQFVCHHTFPVSPILSFSGFIVPVSHHPAVQTLFSFLFIFHPKPLVSVLPAPWGRFFTITLIGKRSLLSLPSSSCHASVNSSNVSIPMWTWWMDMWLQVWRLCPFRTQG